MLEGLLHIWGENCLLEDTQKRLNLGVEEGDLNMGAQLLSQLFLLALSHVDDSTTNLSNIQQVKLQ